MKEDDKLDNLLDQWEERRRYHAEPPAEEICAQSPELLDAFKERVARLKLFESAFGTAPASSSAPGQVGEFCHGRYQVEALHEQGGLGSLYLAHDTELGRTVIVKGIRADRFDRGENQRQFVNEALITAQLEHPGIVPVYSYGQDEHRRPYYAMRMIRGSTLRETIRRFHEQAAAKEARSVEFQRLLRDFLSICQTIHFAHSRGVIHRDIKPANIMLGRFGEVLVVDWGLAKPAGDFPSANPDSDECVNPIRVAVDTHTQLGSVKGSPMYMSPEQAAGAIDAVGPASDVYSLGATLYELLTGKAPFEGAPSAEIIAQVKQGSLRAPRSVKPDVPPALEAICLKAMQRQPADRYASAGAMATDIESFLADEPVAPYVEPLLEVLRRWGRRHRTIVSTAAAALVVALVALMGFSGLLARHNHDLSVAKDAADVARNNAQQAETAERERSAELEKSLYINQLTVAASAWRDADLRRTRAILNATKPELRGLEWQYLAQVAKSPPVLTYHSARPRGLQWITGLQLGNDGAWLFAEEHGPLPGQDGRTRTMHVLASDSGVPKLGLGTGFLAFSPDGSKVLRREPVDAQGIGPGLEKPYRLALVEAATGKTLWQSEPQGDSSYNLFAAAFLTGGAEGEGKSQTLVVVLTDPWTNTDTGQQHRAARLEFRDALSSRLVKTIEGDDVGNATRATFSPDGRRLALSTSAPDTHTVQVLDVASGKTLYTLAGHTQRINAVVFSNDGRKIATASADGSVRIWNGSGGEPLSILWGLHGPQLCVALSPNGECVAAAGTAGGVRVWDIASGQLQQAIPLVDEELFAVVFSRDAQQLLAGGTEGVIYRIDLAATPAKRVINTDDFVEQVRSSADGRAVAAVIGGQSSVVRVYQQSDAKLRFEAGLFDPDNPSTALYVGDAAFLPDGSALAIAGDRFVKLSDAVTGEVRWKINGLQGPIAVTPDGKRIVAFRGPREWIDIIKQENLAGQIHGQQARETIASAVKFGLEEGLRYPSGEKTLLEYLQKDAANEPLIAKIKDQARGTLVVVEASSGKFERVLDFDAAFMDRLAMHPQSPLLAVTDDDTIRVCDLESGKTTATFHIEPTAARRIAYSPDGKRLVVVGVQAREATIVDARNGKVLVRLIGNVEAIQDATYTPDGRRIVTAALDGTLRVWDVESGAQLWVIQASRQSQYALAVAKDGSYLVSGGGNPRRSKEGELILFDVRPVKTP